MATYKEIQAFIKDRHGISVKTCWIAHAKEIFGLHPKIAKNRISIDERKNPCPANKIRYIKEAFMHFNML